MSAIPVIEINSIGFEIPTCHSRCWRVVTVHAKHSERKPGCLRNQTYPAAVDDTSVGAVVVHKLKNFIVAKACLDRFFVLVFVHVFRRIPPWVDVYRQVNLPLPLSIMLCFTVHC